MIGLELIEELTDLGMVVGASENMPGETFAVILAVSQAGSERRQRTVQVGVAVLRCQLAQQAAASQNVLRLAPETAEHEAGMISQAGLAQVG